MQDMQDNKINNPFPIDKDLLKKILSKIEGRDILVFIFFIFAICFLIVLSYIEISWQGALVLIVITICFTFVIYIAYKTSKKSETT